MNLNYINKIKSNISIATNKNTSNILDGSYKSVYKGRSMNFENLRMFDNDDDVKSIDWKASARSASLLVKQFVAEKKHSILLVMDTNKSMKADTDLKEKKEEIALFSAGTIGYLAIKNGDYVGMIYNDGKFEFKPYKYNLYNLEQYLCEYAKVKKDNFININDSLEYVCKNMPKKSIIFIFTDINGINNINSNTLKKLNKNHDVLIVNINDANMNGTDLFDIADEEYIPNFLLKDKKLSELESNIKKNLYDTNMEKLKRNKVTMTSISSLKEINSKIIKLLKEHKYASKN